MRFSLNPPGHPSVGGWFESLGILLAVAAPLPEPHERLPCPLFPIVFENGRDTLDDSGHRRVHEAYDWILDAARGDLRVVLRTHTRESGPIIRSGISRRRAEAVRAALVEQGVPARAIIVDHEYEGGPDIAGDGWVGGWVQPEFFVTPQVLRRLFPPGGAIC